MPPQGNGLSARSLAILEMIAAAFTYEQILSTHTSFTYLDIFDAAKEAMDLSVVHHDAPKPAYNVSEIRTRYPRAYEKWSDNDDSLLLQYIRAGLTVAQISGRLQRQRSAIRSRITKLDLIGELSPIEQSELRRISALDPKDPNEQ